MSQPASIPWALAFWFPVAYAIVRYGAVERMDWYVTLAGIAVVTLLYHVRTLRQQVAPPPGRLLRWALIIFPAYVLCQAIPIPLAVLEHLSPDRAEIAASLNLVGVRQAFAPISVVPSETLSRLSYICGCVLLFLAARNLTWSCPERSWRVAFPLIVVASAESVLGLVQFFTTPVGFAHGTYIHRNHFAALLEMVLPFAVAWPVTRMTRRRSGTDTTKTLRKACLGFTAAALILAAIVYSLSRSGISVALGSLVLMALVVVASRGRGRAALAIAVVGTVLCLTGLLAPERLVDRFQGSFDSSGRLSDVRVRIWMDTARLIADNPVFGSGLGGFEPALYRYRTAALDSRVDYAHNDYLQALAELGFIGLGIAGVFLAALAAESIRAIRRSGQMPLALSATGALAAIAAHSLTDFNLHIPANALVAAWVAGIVSGLAATATESENRRNPCI